MNRRQRCLRRFAFVVRTHSPPRLRPCSRLVKANRAVAETFRSKLNVVPTGDLPDRDWVASRLPDRQVRADWVTLVSARRSGPTGMSFEPLTAPRSRPAAPSYRGSITVVASQKRSISFDESVLAEAEKRASAAGGNLSAFVNTAVLRELRVARGLELLAEDDKALGPVPDEVRATVAEQWPA